jgi:hypothetical protein
MTMSRGSVGAGDGREGVRAARRDDDEVAPLGGDDVLPGQGLGGAVEHEEHLGGVVVPVRARAVGSIGEGDALGGQCPSGRAAVGQQLHCGGSAPDHLGLAIADDDGLSNLGRNSDIPGPLDIGTDLVRRGRAARH